MELFGSNIKKILVSENGNSDKIPYISGNVTSLYFRKLLIFQEITFRALKMKGISYFRKWNVMAPSFKNSYIFSIKTFSYNLVRNFKVPSFTKFLIFSLFFKKIYK